MSNMQREWLKKIFSIVGIFAYLAFEMMTIVLGGGWLYAGLIGGLLVLIPLLFIILYVPIASIIWHWRLMGICENDWEENTLNCWWRFIGYWCGDWENLIPQMIEEDYDDEYNKNEAKKFFERIKAVKKPRWL